MTNGNDEIIPTPVEINGHEVVLQSQGGLTKREYFAATAMTMWGIDTDDLNRLLAEHKPKHDMVAKFCVDFADALIAALNKETK